MGLLKQIKRLFTHQSPAPFHDPDLGDLVLIRSAWRTNIVFDGVEIPLVLAGEKAGPDPQALAIARTLSARYAIWRPEIERALFEHCGAYAEAATAGLPIAEVDIADQVRTQSHVIYVSVLPLDGVLTIEFGYETGWDEEHLVGARFQEGAFLELCGSVVLP